MPKLWREISLHISCSPCSAHMCLIITKPWWNEYFTYYKGNKILLRLSFYSNHLSFNFYEFSKSVLIFFISLTKRVQEPAKDFRKKIVYHSGIFPKWNFVVLAYIFWPSIFSCCLVDLGFHPNWSVEISISKQTS